MAILHGRDVDGTCCLLDALAVPKVSGKKQQDVLSTLAFLTSGSELNAGSVVASRGMATLVPLLLKRSEKTVIGVAKVIANVLISPAGQVRIQLSFACIRAAYLLYPAENPHRFVLKRLYQASKLHLPVQQGNVLKRSCRTCMSLLASLIIV